MDIVEMLCLLYTLTMVFQSVVQEPLPSARRRKLQPRFLPTPTNITLRRGELAKLKCHIYDLGPKVVVWRKEDADVPLTIGRDIYPQEDGIAIRVDVISDMESIWNLIIKDVQVRHSGTYMCQVTATKIYSYYITLRVLDEPVQHKPHLSLSGTIYVNAGEPVELSCNVTGAMHAPEEVDWFFLGNKIVTSQSKWRDRTKILRYKNKRSYVSELTIYDSTLADAGNYLCRSPTLEVKYINVHVLSADINNVNRRGSQKQSNLSQPSDESKSSASILVVTPLSSILTCLLMCSYINTNTHILQILYGTILKMIEINAR